MGLKGGEGAQEPTDAVSDGTALSGSEGPIPPRATARPSRQSAAHRDPAPTSGVGSRDPEET